MINKQTFKNDIEFINNLKNLCIAYEQVSVMKMQKIRKSVVSNRAFYEKISEVYFEVKGSYRKQVEELMKKKKVNPDSIGVKNPQKLMLTGKNDKQVSVLISANTKLYGTILDKVFQLFIKSVKKQSADIVIIGRLGRELFNNSGVNKPYLYFEIPDADIDLEYLKPIIFNLVQYKTINVFYGQFENLVVQTAEVMNVTGDLPTVPTKDVGKVKRFIFEPKLEKVLDFFEKHIFTTLFKQALLEAHLARFASRTRAMEEALEHIGVETKQLRQKKNQFTRSQDEKKQLERIAGMRLWSR